MKSPQLTARHWIGFPVVAAKSAMLLHQRRQSVKYLEHMILQASQHVTHWVVPDQSQIPLYYLPQPSKRIDMTRTRAESGDLCVMMLSLRELFTQGRRVSIFGVL